MKFYTEEEVSLHSIPEDCWISVFDNVLDITSLIQSGKDTKTLLKYAGKSVSHWFDKESREIKTFTDPLRNVTLPYTPEGRILHVASPDPSTEVDISITTWWKDPSLVIGKVHSLTLHQKP